MRLLGIGEEEEADLDRRGFLRLLGGAAVVGVVAPTYVFAPSGGWPPAVAKPMYQFKEMNAVTCDYIVPMLTDNVFKPSPLFLQLAKGHHKKHHRGESIGI